MHIGLNLEQTAHALTLAGTGVVHGVALAHHAGVDADEHQGAHELVGPELECQHHGLVVVGGVNRLHVEHLVAVLVETGGNRAGHSGLLTLERAGEVVHHSVQEALHTLVLESGTTSHGDELVGDGSAADSLLQGRGIDGLLHEEEFAELVVHIGHALLELLEVGLTDFLELALQVLDLIGGTLAVGIAVEDSLLVHHVNLAAELILSTDGHQNGSSVGTQLGADIVEHVGEVGASAVHLVHEADAGHLILVGLAPHRLRLGLHAGNTTEHHDGAVEHAQGTLHLSGEVHVPGGIDNVELEVLVLEKLVAALCGQLFPVGRNGSGGNGDATLLLLLHPVGRRRTLVGLADLVDHAGVEQNALGKRGLAAVNVSGDTEVAVALKRCLAVRAAIVISHIVI